MSLLLKGTLQPQGGYYEISYWAYTHLWYGYSFLYTHFPSFTWLGFSLYVFNYAAAVNISFVLERSLPEYDDKRSALARAVLIILILTVLLIENIFLIDFTRTSILLTGSSVLAAFILLQENRTGSNKISIIICCLLFLTGFFIRPMAAVVVSSLILPFILYYWAKSGKKKFSFLFACTFFLLTVFLYISSQSFRPQSEKESIKHYNSIARIIDYDYEKPGQLSNKQDSIKEKAIKYFFITDNPQISDEFINKISITENIFSDKSTIGRLKASFKYTSIYFYKDYLEITLIYLLLIIFIYYFVFKKNRQGLILFIIVQVIFFAAMIIINTFMKLPERLFVPLYGIFILSNICFFRFPAAEPLRRKTVLTLFAVLTVSFGICIVHTATKVKIVEKRSSDNYQTFSDLENTFNNTTFILGKPATLIADGFYPMKNIPMGSNKIFPFIGWTTTIPSYYKELAAICGSSNINDFINYLKNAKGFLFVSDDEFNNFLIDYFHTLYNNEISFIPEQSTPEILKRRSLSLYKMISK